LPGGKEIIRSERELRRKKKGGESFITRRSTFRGGMPSGKTNHPKGRKKQLDQKGGTAEIGQSVLGGRTILKSGSIGSDFHPERNAENSGA